MQVGQHEPLQLVPDLPFPGHVEHGLFSHATNRSCRSDPTPRVRISCTLCPHLVYSNARPCRPGS